MALNVNAITDRAAGILQDVGSIRYSVADLVKYLSDGQRRTVILRPDLAAVTDKFDIVAGSRQTTENGVLRMVDVIRNVSSTNVYGRAIRRVDRAMMDQEDPNWLRHAASSVIEHWMYDAEKDPHVYWLYPAPKNAVTMKIEASVVFDPPECTIGGALTIDPMFHEPLIDYVVARAVLRDSEFGDQMNRAQFHAQAWATGIGAQKDASL